MIQERAHDEFGAGRPPLSPCCAWLLDRFERLEQDLERRGFRRLEFSDARTGLVPAHQGVDATHFLAADGTWLVPPGGGGEWGTITGKLSDQLDLQAELDVKVSTGLAAGSGLTVSGPDRLLGRDTAGVGAIEEITLGPNMVMVGGVLDSVQLSGTWGDLGGDLEDQTDLKIELDKRLYRQIPLHATHNSNVVSTSVPAADTRFLAGNFRHAKLADLRGCTEVRLGAFVEAIATSGADPRIIAKYSTSWTTTYASWLNLGNAGEVPMSVGTYGVAHSGWIAMAPGAAIETCYLAVGEAGGNGSTTTYTLRSFWLEFR